MDALFLIYVIGVSELYLLLFLSAGLDPAVSLLCVYRQVFVSFAVGYCLASVACSAHLNDTVASYHEGHVLALKLILRFFIQNTLKIPFKKKKKEKKNREETLR